MGLSHAGHTRKLLIENSYIFFIMEWHPKFKAQNAFLLILTFVLCILYFHVKKLKKSLLRAKFFPLKIGNTGV
jgi:hypothetical protein